MIDLVMGGQFGSEGKGEVCNWLAKSGHYDLVVRLASPNSGHTFTFNGAKTIMRQLPTTWKAQDTPIYIPSGSVINLDVLNNEIKAMRKGGYQSPIIVSPNAVMVDPSDIGASGCKTGTTNQGVGEARAQASLRQASLYGGIDAPPLELANPNSRILIESSQGYGLSLHGEYYPYCTSTDINPYQILASSDIPFGVHNIYVWMVIRTFPIRIAGNSGNLQNETTWGEVGVVPEITSVTKKQRRVGMFNHKQVLAAYQMCRPSKVILTFMDYIPESSRAEFLESMQIPIDYVSLGAGRIYPL